MPYLDEIDEGHIVVRPDQPGSSRILDKSASRKAANIYKMSASLNTSPNDRFLEHSIYQKRYCKGLQNDGGQVHLPYLDEIDEGRIITAVTPQPAVELICHI